MRRQLIIATAMCVLAQGCSPTTPAQAFPDDSDLELMLRYLVEDGETQGIVLGVLEADGSTRIVSYGSASEGGRPIEGKSSFEIGSLTKVFTATLLAEMAQQGEVALNDPVSKYLPSEVQVPTFGGRSITLEDLATHTSGLSDATMVEQLSNQGVVDPFRVTVEMMYALISGYSLRTEPGAEFEYSNVGMGLLGHALARAAGTDLRSLIKDRILDPLGMGDTHYGLDEIPAERLVQGHYGGEVRHARDASAATPCGCRKQKRGPCLVELHAQPTPADPARW
jgi:CubicO group peptidase (beta-lactamase class C family)